MKLFLLAPWVLLTLGFQLACSSGDGLPPASLDLEKPEIFWADPKVIQSCDDDLGQTTLNWKVPGVSRVEVRVDGPEGPLFALSGAEESKETGNWVRDGMIFCLVDPDSGKLLATCRARVTRAGCPENQ